MEVVIAQSEKSFSRFGSKGARLPATALMISGLIWSVYLPNDYRYHYFESTLEKEEIIRGVKVFSPVERTYDKESAGNVIVSGEQAGYDELRKVYKGKEAQSRFRSVPMEQEQQARQMKAEMDFNGRMDALSR